MKDCENAIESLTFRMLSTATQCFQFSQVSFFFCVQTGTEVVELTQNSKLNLAKIGVDVLYKQILLSLGQKTKSNKRGEVGKVSSYQTDHQPFSKAHLLESTQIARRYTNWQLRIGNLALACFCAQTLKINPQ